MAEQSTQDLPEEFLRRLKAIKNKRARSVIEHILQHGAVNTEELKNLYGYDHPPRATKDVRDEGIPLETIRVKSSTGRSIAAYRFGDPGTIIAGREGGRKQSSKRFKRLLFDLFNGKCAICNGSFKLHELQIDHRIPYEIGGNIKEPELHPEAHMLVCGSCNRAKSWSCEHCPNWMVHDLEMCRKCYWAQPAKYEHVATHAVRRTEIVWRDVEVEIHDKLMQSAESTQTSLQDYIKNLLKNITQ